MGVSMGLSLTNGTAVSLRIEDSPAHSGTRKLRCARGDLTGVF